MRTLLFALAAASACSTYPASQAPLTPTRSLAGVLLNETIQSGAGGMWIDSVGGIWMDATGTIRLPGPGTPIVGLTPKQIARLTAANVFAHIDAGDSVEIAVSTVGIERGTDRLVVEFAQRMIDEHKGHRRIVEAMAVTHGIAPALAPGDTADAFAGARSMSYLARAPRGRQFDREFIGAQVVLHRHMVHNLRLAQASATGIARRLIDQTLPVVEQHLAAAMELWQSATINGTH